MKKAKAYPINFTVEQFWLNVISERGGYHQNGVTIKSYSVKNRNRIVSQRFKCHQNNSGGIEQTGDIKQCKHTFDPSNNYTTNTKTENSTCTETEEREKSLASRLHSLLLKLHKMWSLATQRKIRDDYSSGKAFEHFM